MKLMRQFLLEKNPALTEEELNSILDSAKEFLRQYYIGGEDFVSGLNCCEVYWNQQLKDVVTNV
jgi:hypothetical protein